MARAKNKPRKPRKPRKPNPTPKVKQIEAALTKPVDPLIELRNILTVETVRKVICPIATNQEIGFFLGVARSCGLNPFKREIYLIKYDAKAAARVVVGYETYLKRGARAKGYRGFEVWTEPENSKNPTKACCRIHIDGWAKPFYHEIYVDEYVQTFWDDKARKTVITKMWRKMLVTMSKKVVVSQTFRMAFPEEMAGMPYCDAEIPHEETKDAEATVTPVVTHVKMPERTDKPDQAKPEAKKPDPPKEPAKPAQPAVKCVSPGQIETLKNLCVAKNLDPDEIAHSYFGADSVKTLPANKAGMFMNEVSKIK